MKEAATKIVIWNDVDKQTFTFFTGFVYTGAYNVTSGGTHLTGSGHRIFSYGKHYRIARGEFEEEKRLVLGRSPRV